VSASFEKISMSPHREATAGWLKRSLAWSNSRESWEERIGFAVILAAAVALFWIRGHLLISQEVVLWALLVVALAVLLRRGWLRLIGPMLFYDLVRVARRPRYFFLRCVYALLLSLLLGWVYLVWYLSTNTGRMQPNEMARFAETFFYTFMTEQLIVVFVLTPAYTAGAIAEEKDRKTLEFLLATDLRNREIVLSKLLSRLANITLLVLAGLPILSFLQFLGGVDPNLVLAGFAATGLTMVSLAGLSILNSVLTKRPRDAISATYLGAAAYLILSAASWALLLYPGMMTATWIVPWLGPVTVKDFAHAVSIGNIVVVCLELTAVVSSGKNLVDSLPGALRDYALFHGCVALICTSWAVLRLRALAIKQSYGKAQKVAWRRRFWRRPAVGTRPMLWKEIFVESGLRLNVLVRIVVIVLVVASFIPVVLILEAFFDEFFRTGRMIYRYIDWETMSRAMNIWVRVLGSMVACLMLLAVAARASSSISNERDRQTFDALLTSPLDSNAILFGKWIGNILSVRWAWLWLGTIYTLGLLTGGLNPLALPLLVAAWIVYAFVVSGIGLWFSMVSRTTLRGTLWTLLCTTGAGVGHWLLWMCCIPLFITVRQEPEVLEWVRKFQVGFTPPLALGFSFAFCSADFNGPVPANWALEAILYGVLGVVCWIVLGACIAVVNSTRFRVLTGRVPVTRPQAVRTQRRTPPPALGGPTEAIAKPEIIVSLDGEATNPLDVVAVEQASPEIRGIKPSEEIRPEDGPPTTDP
jgi:ABC-type transport system involved in multi-copper enzyme maturation permease subunit